MRQVNDRLEKDLGFLILPEIQKTTSYALSQLHR